MNHMIKDHHTPGQGLRNFIYSLLTAIYRCYTMKDQDLGWVRVLKYKKWYFFLWQPAYNDHYHLDKMGPNNVSGIVWALGTFFPNSFSTVTKVLYYFWVISMLYNEQPPQGMTTTSQDWGWVRVSLTVTWQCWFVNVATWLFWNICMHKNHACIVVLKYKTGTKYIYKYIC